MSLDTPFIPLGQWLPEALASWLWLMFGLMVIGLVAGLIFATARLGPIEGPKSLALFVPAAFVDLARMSPRRVLALARLAVLESIRRSVLGAFVVFMAILLIGGWYLDPSGADPARRYLSFVLGATSLLTTLLALFLSVFSLPADLRNKTIYTIVTKPVRPSEIVLGRILGFTAIGTAMLALTGLASYFFVTRGLNHTHEVVENSLEAETNREGPTGTTIGRTTQVQGHRHEVRIDAQGRGQTSMEQGHVHDIIREESGGKTRYRLGPPLGLWQARVPLYGTLRFLDRQGVLDPRSVPGGSANPGQDAQTLPGGIDVGKEKKRQGWIEGGTQAAAIWTFEGIREEEFPDGLPLELNLGVFRTAAGNVGQGVLGSITIKSVAKPQASSAARNFVAQDYRSDLQFIPRKLPGPEGQELDLYRDLIKDGKVEIWITCLQNEQYLGMAPTDLYLRAPDAPFFANFLKGYSAIWLQMVIVITVGVTLSTFLNAAVALLGTLGILMGGFVKGYILDVAFNRVLGGGPIEAMLRTVLQINQTVPLEPGLGTTLVQRIDQAYRVLLQVVSGAVPDLSAMSGSTIVAQGYNIPFDLLVEQGLTALAYVIPVFIVGFVLFKLREVAR